MCCDSVFNFSFREADVYSLRFVRRGYCTFVDNAFLSAVSFFYGAVFFYSTVAVGGFYLVFGCNYCVELAPKQFQMSKKDGKSVLLHSQDKKGFFTLKSPDASILENATRAKEACPVKIISVKLK